MTTLRDAPNVRVVSIQWGDTLKSIALRELGDATQWVAIGDLNNLEPPYIVAPPATSAGVLAYGQAIRVPAPASTIAASDDPAAVFDADLSLAGGVLTTLNGDLALAVGLPNLSQALANRIRVHKRELLFHPEYGCHVKALVGAAAGPVSGQLAAFYVQSSLMEDPRVDRVTGCTAAVTGDEVSVEATVQPITGAPQSVKVLV